MSLQTGRCVESNKQINQRPATMNSDGEHTLPKRNFFDKPFLLRIALIIGKFLPYRWGSWLAAQIGLIIGSVKHSKLVQAIRANQYVIHDKQLDQEALAEIPRKVFRSASVCFFDYVHYLPRPEKLQKVVTLSDEAKSAIERIRRQEPTVFVCPHLSNFELMGYVFALKGLDVQVLSVPQPKASYRLQNHLRQSSGITITPMSLSAFRQARERLNGGGSILTGLDRPISGNHLEKYQPIFFGHPANLPVFYVRMAKEANAPVIIMAATSQPDGGYRLIGSSPIWMDSGETLETEILANANRVLHIAEDIIRENALQWAMFYPIWPHYLGV